MKHRVTKALILVGVSCAAYVVKLTGDHTADWFADMGAVYECSADQFYTGSGCQKRLFATMYSPPCPNGWDQRGKRCLWKGEEQ